jgi:hypothetical protein
MALIGTIRKNGWILIATMVLALGGFILMDIVSNTQRYGAGDVNSLGNVNGKEIKRSEFDNYEKLVYTNAQGNSYQIRTTGVGLLRTGGYCFSRKLKMLVWVSAETSFSISSLAR